ncbi:MAG: VWA domain-containing protein [Candidatus Marinimicrobia bacterium]|nr:VWA domain-containing protein [Candidatus Neomarinimicrobiota bacterium]
MEVQIKSKLPETITTFCRLLRDAGFDLGTGDILSAITAVNQVGVNRRDDFKQALKCSLITQRNMIPLFDQAFDLFWRNPDKLKNVSDILRKLFESRLAQVQLESLRQQKKRAKGIDSFVKLNARNKQVQNDEEPVKHVFLYSRDEILRKKEFESYTDEELLEARELLNRYDWNLGNRLLRRLTPGNKRYRLHMRRTIRKNIYPSQDFIKLAWRKKKNKPRPVVILCDISGSMEVHTRILLHFMHTYSGIDRKVETFTFGTRLTRITHYLKQKDPDIAINQVSKSVEDWAGGTRIGEAIAEFNHRWARRVLSGGAVVILISDGWDTGNIELLEKEMARLHRSCFRLIWLNPNLGFEGYQPLTLGIQAVLPHVDNFLPIHNLECLMDLGKVLSNIDKSPKERGRFYLNYFLKSQSLSIESTEGKISSSYQFPTQA